MLNKLIHGSVGFSHGVRAAAFLILGCLAIGNLLMRKPNSPIPNNADTSTNTNSSDDERNAEESKNAGRQIEQPFWDFSFAVILLVAFLTSLGSYFPVYYVQQFAEMHGIREDLYFYSIAILNAANMFGRIVPNYFADKFGTWIVFTTLVLLNGNAGRTTSFCPSLIKFRSLDVRYVRVRNSRRSDHIFDTVSNMLATSSYTH